MNAIAAAVGKPTADGAGALQAQSVTNLAQNTQLDPVLRTFYASTGYVLRADLSSNDAFKKLLYKVEQCSMHKAFGVILKDYADRPQTIMAKTIRRLAVTTKIEVLKASCTLPSSILAWPS